MINPGMTAKKIAFKGAHGDEIEGYYVQPEGNGPFPSVVVIQHIFGVDEWIQEVCRKLAHHGYAALAPNLYSRIGDVGTGTPQEVSGRMRELGGVNDETVTGDLQASTDHLRALGSSNGKVGTIGFCMGGRYAYLAACEVKGTDAAVDCWGGGVNPLPNPAGPPSRPLIGLTEHMASPLLGIFGNDDLAPDPDEVNRTEATLKELNKPYEFHRYDGAGHGFFAPDRANYRQAQATDAWTKVFAFYEKYLGASAGAK